MNSKKLDAISQIEMLAAADIQGRNIGPLAAQVQGNLELAARHIINHPSPHIAIITGFYMSYAEPPACETDGPPGATMLAEGLTRIGIPCRLCTDAANAPVIQASLVAAGVAGLVKLDVVANDKPEQITQLDQLWRDMTPAVSHVIALERCGPSADGTPRNAAGQDIGRFNAPLEKLLDKERTSISIGDLGNEVGMGCLSQDLVSRTVPNGEVIWCKVPCDYLLICGISNWGAAALLAAIGILQPNLGSDLAAVINPDEAERHMRNAVEKGGAVSGDSPDGRPYPCLFVDEVAWGKLKPTFAAIHQILRSDQM